jgi:hypothetical protein
MPVFAAKTFNFLVRRYLMTTRLALTAVLVCTLSSSLPVNGQGKKGKSNSALAALNGWLFSLPQGTGQAQAAGKPLMVVFRCDP